MNKNIAHIANNRKHTTTTWGWSGNYILKRISHALVAGMLAVIVFGMYFTRLDFVSIASTGFLLAGASFICGAFLGFLFGIPRTAQIEEEKEDSSGKKVIRNSYKPNTNLEQISDWLTKILVGVGLTQINRIIDKFNLMVGKLSQYFGNNEALIAAMIIYFLVFGFMLGFLWSRLYMAGALIKAEAEAANQALEDKIVQKIQDKVDEQAKQDASALSLTNQQLDTNLEPVAQEMLNEAIAKASPAVKVTIFNQAQNFRQVHWRQKPEKVIRTIPVFKALAQADPEEKFHRTFGQWGYALKDQQPPDFKTAEEMLSRAINIRNRLGLQSKWLLYEFNRAYCRIMINQIAGRDVFTSELILQDIEIASQSSAIKKIINEERIFVEWLQLHR